jgi:Mg-chelatase subunit ChlI
MKTLSKITIIAALMAVNFVLAQNADDYFHLASNFYINGNAAQAMGSIAKGLQKFPTDSKLQALKNKIEEEREQQQNQQNQNEKQNQDQKEDQAQKDQQDQQEKEEQQRRQEQERQAAKENEQKQDEEQEQVEAEEPSEDELSKEEAERILQALQEDEKEAQKKKRPVKASGRRTGKDW